MTKQPTRVKKASSNKNRLLGVLFKTAEETDPRAALRKLIHKSRSDANQANMDTEALDWADNAAHLSEQSPVKHGLKGALGGGALGALMGGAIGSGAGTLRGAGIGAAIGGLSLGALGGYAGATAPGRGKKTLQHMSEGGATPVEDSMGLSHDEYPAYREHALRPEHQEVLRKIIASRAQPSAKTASLKVMLKRASAGLPMQTKKQASLRKAHVLSILLRNM